MSNNIEKKPNNVHHTEKLEDVNASEAASILKDREHGVIIGNLWGYISDVNKPIIEMYRANSKSEFIGKHVLNFLVKEEKERAVLNSLDSIRNDKGRIQTYRVYLKNGEAALLEVKTFFIRNKKGEKTGFVDIIRRISDCKS
jgi:PAS domain S-box-containing protein